MEQPNPENCYDSIVDTLFGMFGELISKDVILSVVRNCGGSLGEAANDIMNLMEESEITLNNVETKNNDLEQSSEAIKVATEPIQFSFSGPKLEVAETPFDDAVLSYATASRTGAVPKQITRVAKTKSNNSTKIENPQFDQIISFHIEGSRTLVIMRGLPGSGKSHLARKIIDTIYNYSSLQNYYTHIFSTDDYFVYRGVYRFDQSRLSEAHEWNQKRAQGAMIEGISPVIIDNTNVEIWEMEPYVRWGVQNGYIIEVLEPNTPWAKKKHELSRRSVHNVPVATIQRKLDQYVDNITGSHLRKQFGCVYRADMEPPVKREFPPIPVTNLDTSSENIENKSDISVTNEHLLIDVSSIPPPAKFKFEPEHKIPAESGIEEVTSEETNIDSQYKEIQKTLEEFEKVENEWDNGENWDEAPSKSNENTDTLSNSSIDAKPQRTSKSTKFTTCENLLSSVNAVQDWTKISMYMPSLCDDIPLPKEEECPIIEKVSSSTCMESSDTDIFGSTNPLKIITATPRDINQFHIGFRNEKIPGMWMLDKSTSTNEENSTYRCQNEEKHFNAFRKLFKNIPQSDLRDIFEKCCGDVNWAVDIVLDSMTNRGLNMTDKDDLSDLEAEAESNEQCECTAAYNIIPNLNEVSPSPVVEDQSTEIVSNTSFQSKKSKKQTTLSEASLQLKRQIEQNFVIPDNLYSEHCLKIRKIRRGEFEVEQNHSASNPGNTSDHKTPPKSDIDTSFVKSNDQNTSNEKPLTEYSDEDSITSGEEPEPSVQFELGKEFISQLDAIFGRNSTNYPDYVSSKINMPMSLLHEINALWMQSLSYQLEENAKQLDIMMQQDQEFARQLAMREAELLASGKEQAIPDFKEIMDMDFALHLYQKDVAEWRNNEPNDLAAKLTREKLYNLFPDIQPDTLSELLMAHDNNFQTTVEVLLMSTGQTTILETSNGINKYIMEKEMQRQEKLLEAEKKALLEVEWPLLPKGENVDMSVVEEYRREADKHLANRNTYYKKAQDYMNRGITAVATYYSDVAAYHKRKYEQANSMAAASLMQIHAKNCSDNATIDLHFLRVAEAKETLDLFLDTHIQKLREMQNKNGVKCHTLFFITGRGLHSHGRPRVKPAVKKRLNERGIQCSERNPGLLTAKVYAVDKLSHQLE